MNPLFPLIRSCHACTLRDACQGTVPGEGPLDALVFFIGEAPGQREDKEGRPFQGPAGQFLNALLAGIGLAREDVFISNTCKCRPRGNRTPTVEEGRLCAGLWLEKELELVRPRFIVPMGVPAARWVWEWAGLGEFDVMEKEHGQPRLLGNWANSSSRSSINGSILVPSYHPAAGLHNTSLIRDITADFSNLGKLVRGECQPQDLMRVDEYPHPEYITAPDVVTDAPLMALDTEIVDGKLWSVQVSSIPGTGITLPGDWRPQGGKRYIVHNWLFDSEWVNLPDFEDTMVMAYLLGLPQGLKELAFRLCGMEMKSYQDMVKPYRKEKVMEWLSEAMLKVYSNPDFYDPPDLIETKWDNKTHSLLTKVKHPQHISKKINSIIRDVEKGKVLKDGPVDPWERWHKIPTEEREVVEAVLGPCPDGDLSDVPPAEAAWYCGRDPDATLRVHGVLSQQIREWGLEVVYGLDKATLPIAREMMHNGMKVDVEGLRRLGEDYLQRMRGLALVCQAIRPSGEGFNPNSDQQVAKVVYEELGFTPTAFTPTGLPSVTEKELKKVKHGIITPILDYRHLAHIRDSFVDTLISRADDAGRVHPTIKTTRTETGRWSMAEPNLQQIPVRTEIGRAIREQFLAEGGNILFACDFSQIELRCQAYLAQCKGMMETFQQGGDIHMATACFMFEVPPEQVTAEMRRVAKILNFGVIYGLSDYGLQENLKLEGIERERSWCKQYINQMLHVAYPEVADWQQETIAFAKRNGYVRDMMGGVRFVPELRCPVKKVQSAGERQAINMPVQSTAARIMKQAMVDLWQMWQEKDLWWAKWLLAVHDELIWECPEDRVEELKGIVVPAMEQAVALEGVPIVAESKSGYRWGSMK